MKPIRFSGHAQQQIKRRGIERAEVIETIQTANWQSAKGNRIECQKPFPFASFWNNSFYETKLVRPIFVEEAEEIVVITVYSYYFS